ncbi:MAG: AmmeMemoRadiSam system radical SAM enzyme [Elusimicrobiota bacterium]
MIEAKYYEKKDGDTVQCRLCPHNCVISPGKTGICRIRKNDKGKLFPLTYDQVTSLNLDPIEKKPLYHFFPGSDILSVGTLGCSFRCDFCQNWEISQAGIGDIPTRKLTSEMALKMAKESKSVGMAYTYNEPLVNFEWLLETAKVFSWAELKNVLVTNGYINPEPLKELLRYVDAANIDVKAFTEQFYQKLCGAKLEPVLRTVETMVREGKHVELTTLLIPGENDNPAEIEKLVDWIASLSDRIPLHFSRFFPQYKLEVVQTPVKTLLSAYEIAKKKLKYVYLGNVMEQEHGNTYCPSCGETAIERAGYSVKFRGPKKNACPKCGTECDIVSG